MRKGKFTISSRQACRGGRKEMVSLNRFNRRKTEAQVVVFLPRSSSREKDHLRR